MAGDFENVFLERGDSTESEASVKEYDRAPATTEYILQIDEGVKKRQLAAKLKEGKDLPYRKILGGEIIFSISFLLCSFWLRQELSYSVFLSLNSSLNLHYYGSDLSLSSLSAHLGSLSGQILYYSQTILSQTIGAGA